MAKDTVDVMVEGGKATAAPPLGPALGPMGVNIGLVVSEINKKTAEFKGMRVPVKVIIDKDTKAFDIRIGTPPASALIKKEAGIEKGAGNPKIDKVADLKIEQIIKISKMKSDALLGKDNIARVKEIIGSCNSMGVLVEGKPAVETLRDIENGMFKEKILAGKTELSAEELRALDEEKKKLQAEIEARKAEYEAKAKSIIAAMAGKARGEIKTKLVEAGIPVKLIEQLLPVESAAGAAGAAGAAAAPGAAAGGKPGAEKK
jgi:large subunit ribosomal protein L11